MRSVRPDRAAASVSVSNDHSRALVAPPKPFQRAIGRKNLRDRHDVRPCRAPAFRHAGQRQPAIGIGREDAQLQPVRPAHRMKPHRRMPDKIA
jgi:hypothetical protein